MADVQKDHGHVQIANRLLEAIIKAGFTCRQHQILLALFRLTYGWRKRSVLLTELELARLANAADEKAKRAGGAFRADLGVLLRWRIVLRQEAPEYGRRGQFVWAINKNFEDWGVFSVAENRLAATYGSKPRWDREHERGVFELARTQATSIDEDEDDEWPEDGPDMRPISGPDNGEDENAKWPGIGPQYGLVPGQMSEPKSLSGETYEAGKTLKDSSSSEITEKRAVASISSGDGNSLAAANGETSETAGETAEESAPPAARSVPEPAPVERDPETLYAIGLTSAVNVAEDAKYGEPPSGPLRYPSALKLAKKLMAEGISLALAQHAITAKVQVLSERKPVNYFAGCIRDAYADAQQRLADAKYQKPVVEKLEGLPSRVSPLTRESRLELERQRTSTQLALEHGRLQTAAGEAWRDDPPNAERVAAIAARVKQNYETLDLQVLGGSRLERAIDAEVVELCARASGFPDFETWLVQRPPDRPVDGPEGEAK